MPGVPYVTCRMSLYDSFMKKLGTTSSTTQGTTSRDPCWTDQDFLLYVFPLPPLFLKWMAWLTARNKKSEITDKCEGLTISCWHTNRLMQYKFLVICFLNLLQALNRPRHQGRVNLPLKSIPTNVELEHSFPLHPIANQKDILVCGAVKLRLQYMVYLTTPKHSQSHILSRPTNRRMPYPDHCWTKLLLSCCRAKWKNGDYSKTLESR